MRVELSIAATDPAGRTFLTWSPVKATARLAEPDGATTPVAVTLRNGGAGGGGRVVFDTVRSDDDKSDIELQLPADGSPVDFWVAGEFGHPSEAYGDAAVEATAGGAPIGRLELMVRVRKNAVKLTAAERDRFLEALGTLNHSGQGPFQSFRETHVLEAVEEAHGYAGFPPWHRAYLLDLERELQAIDPSVALPYWRFDEAAAALFAPDFLGMPPPDPEDGDLIQFPSGHPLENWQTDATQDPIERRPRYNVAGPPPTQVATPVGLRDWVITQQQVLALGDQYAAFRSFEGAPHGPAHSSFRGPVADISEAAKDPLFFLLHCNVDRLWALWQWYYRRHDPDQEASYSLAGEFHRDPDDLGHKLDDTMWPWNGVRGDGSAANPRPQFDPTRHPFPESPLVARPGGAPTVRDMIDYQGVSAGESLGFDYDDVPFELG